MLDKENTVLWLDKLSRFLVAAAAVAAVYVLVIQALVHFPYYDESMHMRQLWRISIGMKPGVDYFSSYPALAYLFLSPVLKLFPETAYVLLVFRFINIFVFIAVGALIYYHGKRVAEDWESALLPLILLASINAIGSFFVELSIDHYAALAAVGAIVLIFQEPEVRKAALASALAFLSLLITPKYALPVFFGFLGYLASAYFMGKNIKKLVAGIAAGGATTAILAALVFWAYDISLIGNIKTSHLLAPKMVMAKDLGYLVAIAILKRLWSVPLYGAIVVLGVAGWAKRSFRSRDAVSLVGAGIFLGIVVHCLSIKFYLEQYQSPVYVTLAMFAPFTFYLFGRNTASKVVKSALSLAVLAAVTIQIPAAHKEFDQTVMNFRGAGITGVLGPPCVKVLPYYDKLLEVIPKEEKIVALWCNNPLFRMDVTGVLGDDRPSFSELLEKDDLLQRFFKPEYLKAELVKTPPALIDFFMLHDNYPPGWEDILWDYVVKNRDNYKFVVSPVDNNIKMALRADLADKWKNVFPDYPPYPLIP